MKSREEVVQEIYDALPEQFQTGTVTESLFDCYNTAYDAGAAAGREEERHFVENELLRLKKVAGWKVELQESIDCRRAQEQEQSDDR